MTEGSRERPASEPLPDERRGLRIKGWVVESSNQPILSSLALEQWQENLGTSHLPEMVFGNSFLSLIHEESGIKIHFNAFDALQGWKQESLPPVEVPAAAKWKFKRWQENLGTSHLPEMVFGNSFLSLIHEESGIKIHFNAFDALQGWKQESLPPVEVPAAAKWKFKSKPFQQVILDYDYTFTTPYCGSETLEVASEPEQTQSCLLKWEDCDQKIDLDSPALREAILFYDEVVLYEDELADNGVSLLTAKVRVMPDCWFLLLRFWLRVDGVLMRLRDTRVCCSFGSGSNDRPTVLRDICWREATFSNLSLNELPLDSATFIDPNHAGQRLPVINRKTQKLVLGG